jgi:hypothetical protein
MSEQFDETFLTSLTDDVVSDLFSSGNNVIIPAGDDPIEPQGAGGNPNDDEDDPVKLDLTKSKITNPSTTLVTDDLLEDVIKSTSKPQKPTKSTPDDPGKGSTTDLGFDMQELYDEGLLLPFDEDSEISNVEDLKALIKANKEESLKQARETALTEYKESLPEAAKLLLKYAENGGDEFSSIVKYLGANERQKELDLENEADQKEIIRQYYIEQDWSEDDIEDELNDLEDDGPEKLKDRATKFKPKVDAFKQKKIDAEIKKAEELESKRKVARETYVKSVTDTLSTGKLGGISLNKTEQKDVYDALITERYNSISGPTNRLGALLDKIQYIEPNFELLAKVTMYLSDEKGFEAKIAEKLKQDITVDTVKKLKTAQGLKRTASPSNHGGSRSNPNLTQAFKNPFE